MSIRRNHFIAVATSALLVVCAVCLAQGAKPWERPGARVGEEIAGPDGGVLVWVPAGEFMMGSDEVDGEGPLHTVRLTKGFWLGKCEVTNEQYRAFCKATGRIFPAISGSGPKHPIVGVTWYDAKAYCDRYGLAVPTEAQWEYAARGPEGRTYPWGNEWDPQKCCNLENQGTGAPPTMAVGSIPAGNSWCGASDMAGNVWEWTADWYGAYAKSPQEDPKGPDDGEYRPLRGGSWHNGPESSRCASRGWYNPGLWDNEDGFRVVRTP